MKFTILKYIYIHKVVHHNHYDSPKHPHCKEKSHPWNGAPPCHLPTVPAQHWSTFHLWICHLWTLHVKAFNSSLHMLLKLHSCFSVDQNFICSTAGWSSTHGSTAFDLSMHLLKDFSCLPHFDYYKNECCYELSCTNFCLNICFHVSWVEVGEFLDPMATPCSTIWLTARLCQNLSYH